jgi:hypothetical protein
VKFEGVVGVDLRRGVGAFNRSRERGWAGIVSKSREGACGALSGGKSFSRGALALFNAAEPSLPGRGRAQEQSLPRPA